MSPSNDREIRRWLAAYLAGEISLSAFEDWFVPATWDLHRSDDPVPNALAGEIKLRLAEFSSGHWTEDELKERLHHLAPRWFREPNLMATSSSVTHRAVVAFPLRTVGTPGATVHV
jgi:hypothetical protein